MNAYFPEIQPFTFFDQKKKITYVSTEETYLFLQDFFDSVFGACCGDI